MPRPSPLFQPTNNVRPLFKQPDRSTRLWQAGGDALTGIGMALMNQQPGPYPVSPLNAVGQGLQYGQQLGRQRQDDLRQAALDDMRERQFSMQEAEFALQQEDRKRQQAAQEAQTQVVEQALQELPPEQQALARANPDAFLKHVMETKFAKPAGPSSAIAKIQDDLAKGFITPEQARAAINKETYIAPQQPQQAPETIRLMQAAGIDPASAEGKAILQQKLAGSNGITIGPDGTVQIGGPAKPATGEQMQAVNRATLFKTGWDKLSELYTNPDIGAWNMAAAETAEMFGPLGRVAGAKLRTAAEQQWQAAHASALEGLAAAVTGAGVTNDQFTRFTSMLPAPTDEDPKVREFKLKAANDFLAVALQNAGPAGQALLDTMKGGPKKAPIVGTVEDGHRFKGGDPANPANWEKVQ